MGQELATRKTNSLVPAKPAELQKFAATVLASFKIPSSEVLADPDVYMTAMVSELSRRRFPISVVAQAYQARLAEDDWLPTTAGMVKACEGIMRRRSSAAWNKKIERLNSEAEQERRAEERKAVEPLARLAQRKYNISEQHTHDAADALRSAKAEFAEWQVALQNGEEWAIRATLFLAGHSSRTNVFVAYQSLKPPPDPCANLSPLARQASEKQKRRAGMEKRQSKGTTNVAGPHRQRA